MSSSINMSSSFHVDFSYLGKDYNLDLVAGNKSEHSIEINGISYTILGEKEKLSTACELLKSISLDSIQNSEDLKGRLASLKELSFPFAKKTEEIGLDILHSCSEVTSAPKTSPWSEKDERNLPERRQAIAHKYWEVGVLKGEKDHDGLKGFLADTSSDPSLTEKLFDEAISKKNFELFFSLFNHLSRNQVVLINDIENLNAIDFGKTTHKKKRFTEEDISNLKQYVKDTRFSGIITLSDGKSSYTVRSEKFEENGDPQIPFSIHSVGKVFTGVLTFLMMEKGVVHPDKAVITKEILESPIQLEPNVLKALPPALQRQLAKKTMHQVMLHQGGFGDYLPRYEAAIENDLSKNKTPTQISKPEEFLKYADDQIIKLASGEGHYSNLGILLIGLSIQYHYNKDISEKIQITEKHIEYLKNKQEHVGSGSTGRAKKASLNTQIEAHKERLEKLKAAYKPYNKILDDHVLKPSGVSNFSVQKPKNGRFNNEQAPIAGHISGSPGGGYWATSEDLQNFGDWVNKKCSSDPSFLSLIEAYGGEFYSKEHRQIDHTGFIDSSTAHLSTFIDNGVTIGIVSDQGQLAASLINGAIVEHMLAIK